MGQYLKTTTGGYNIGIGYNPFTENITGTNNIGIGYWSGGTVWGVTIHLSIRQNR
jgi:hypothetical protein